MKFLTYEEAVESKAIFRWAGGQKVAQRDRFDKNTKFVIDNQNALKGVVQEMINGNQKTIQTNLNRISTLKDETQKSIGAIGNIADFRKGMGVA
jgi:hypothetical protein